MEFISEIAASSVAVMEPNSLIQHIEKLVPLTEEAKVELLSLVQVKKLRKKDVLIYEGDISYYSNFVDTGLLRLYAVDKTGVEHVIQFAPPGWWIGDMGSILKQQAGRLYIDALENSTVFQLRWSSMQELYTKHPIFETYFRVLAENSLAAYQSRLLNHLSMPARDRYAAFCQLYPSLIDQLPQKQIASYIGVTPEFFSKMMSQPALKK